MALLVLVFLVSGSYTLKKERKRDSVIIIVTHNCGLNSNSNFQQSNIIILGRSYQ